MQGDMKADGKTEDPQDERTYFVPILSRAIDDVANELGIIDPSKYQEPKELGDGGIRRTNCAGSPAEGGNKTKESEYIIHLL